MLLVSVVSICKNSFISVSRICNLSEITLLSFVLPCSSTVSKYFPSISFSLNPLTKAFRKSANLLSSNPSFVNLLKNVIQTKVSLVLNNSFVSFVIIFSSLFTLLSNTSNSSFVAFSFRYLAILFPFLFQLSK